MRGDDIVSDYGRHERDVLSGGAGFDKLSYAHSADGDLTVTLDGVANDGLPGENDNIPTDFEHISLGDGDDTFVGNDLPATVFGGGGNDSITGGGGRDRLHGQFGEDVFHTSDGRTDWVWGGNGQDEATDRDPIDRVRHVELL